MKSSLTWPVVAIICAVIVAPGIYFGIRDGQPQPVTRTYISSSSGETSSTNSVTTDTDMNDAVVYVTTPPTNR